VPQRAALAALQATPEIVGGIVRQLQARRARALGEIRRVPRFVLSSPESSYYLWVDVRGWYGCTTPGGERIAGDTDLAEFLLNDARVAVVAGTSCRLPGYFRLTFAVPEETFALGVRRIAESLEKLRCPGP
jgi:aspartate aminotransferase